MIDSAMLDIRVIQQASHEQLETAVAATEEESVLLAEKLTEVAIPLEVLMQALNIAKYDKAAAFRYADNYLNKTRKFKWILRKDLPVENKASCHKNIENSYRNSLKKYCNYYR